MTEIKSDRAQPKTLWKHIRNGFGMLALAVAVAFGGVYFGSLAEKASIDYRTSEATEVHKLLSHPYIHLGDGVPVDKVKLGSVFYVHTDYVKLDTCHVQVSNVFWGVDSKIAHHYSMFVNWFNAGTFEVNEFFIATPELPPGRYKIVKKTVHMCSGKEHYSTNFSIPVEFVR